ncbi:MAG: hypothetical protein KDB61_08325, partial [Planctomycetes bacterium]|nr:hypothetical protein [Planctomycetota bacterium]
SGECSLFDAHALFQFGVYLRDLDDPIRAYKEIKVDNEHKRTLKTILLWGSLERMVAYREYKDVLGFLPDPTTALAARIEAIKAREKGAEILVSDDLPSPSDLKEEEEEEAPKVQPEPPLPGIHQTRARLIIDAANMYECLLALEKPKEAKALMEMVTDFESTGESYAMFIEHANRLRLLDLAQSLADRGCALVPEDQIPIIQSMLLRGRHHLPK